MYCFECFDSFDEDRCMMLPQLCIVFDCFDSFDEDHCVMLPQLCIVLSVLIVLMKIAV